MWGSRIEHAHVGIRRAAQDDMARAHGTIREKKKKGKGSGVLNTLHVRETLRKMIFHTNPGLRKKQHFVNPEAKQALACSRPL